MDQAQIYQRNRKRRKGRYIKVNRKAPDKRNIRTTCLYNKKKLLLQELKFKTLKPR